MEGCGNAKHRHYHSLIFLININLHLPNMWFLRHQRWVFIGHIRFSSSGVGLETKQKDNWAISTVTLSPDHRYARCGLLLLNLLLPLLLRQPPLRLLVELSCQFLLMCSSLFFCSHLILAKWESSHQNMWSTWKDTSVLASPQRPHGCPEPCICGPSRTGDPHALACFVLGFFRGAAAYLVTW